jgi:shikimate 5-dehydrogenase
MREAAAAGATVQNGDVMLIHQSAAAFGLWTGQQAPIDLLTSTLDEARDRAPEPAGVAETAEA